MKNTPTNKAKEGISLVEKAILEFIATHPQGVSNAEIAKALNLESDIAGNHKNYLSWSILGNLNRRLIIKQGARNRARYLLNDQLLAPPSRLGL